MALAALLSPAFKALRDEGVVDPADGQRRPLRNVAAIICGGNVDPQKLYELCSEGE